MSDAANTNRSGLPSAEDLDAMAKEAEVAAATSGTVLRDFTIFSVESPPAKPLTEEELWGGTLESENKKRSQIPAAK